MDDILPGSEGIEGKCAATNMANLESHEVEGKFTDGEENSSVIGEEKDTQRLQSSTNALSVDVSSSGVGRVRSSVWEHYTIVEEGSMRFAVCKLCAKRLKQSRTAGTGTLRHHLLVHERVRNRSVSGGKQKTMENFQKKDGPSSAAYGNLNLMSTKQREFLVNWMVRRNIPFAEVDDISFREFVFSLNDGIRVISRRTLREDLTRSYDTHKPALVERLSRLPGGICVGVDGWTSESQRRNYIAVVITFIEKWERKSLLLSLKTTEIESHTGEVIANLIYDVLKSFEIHSKLVAMASDNGSNMVSAWLILVDLCAKDGITVDLEMHARCVCHVVNLVVRLFMKEIGANKSYNADELENSCPEAEEGYAHAVNIVRYLTSFVHSSPKRLSKFRSNQLVAGKVLLPVTETLTRWNSTYLMLQSSMEIRAALQIVLVGEKVHRDMYPTDLTWRQVGTVVSFLAPFYRITQESQGDQALTSAVPSYNEIFDHLDDWEAGIGRKLEGATTAERGRWLVALDAAKTLLSKYYSKTDSRLYSCVTFCDPRLRGYYWMDAQYESHWIERAKSQVRDVYSAKYALHGHGVSQAPREDHATGSSIQRAMRKRARENVDELSLYEDGFPAAGTVDPLAWWKLHEAEFPGICRMSLDMLAIPATTAQVERIFSLAKLILTDGRSNLDAELAGKIACLGSWLRDVGLKPVK
jgi:hAT family C-terminal dimerisation region/BED zinc finger